MYIRSAGIVVHEGKILLMFRRLDGKEYFVFPGGHVDPGETLEQTAVREVLEETSVSIAPIKPLYHHTYEERSERWYFLCEYLSGEPKLGPGPEMHERMSETNYYEPQWVSLRDLPTTLVYPLEIRDWIIEDVKTDFVHALREAHVVQAEMRQTL